MEQAEEESLYLGLLSLLHHVSFGWTGQRTNCLVYLSSQLYGDQARFFDAEKVPRIKHKKKGTVSMVNNGNDQHGSQVNKSVSLGSSNRKKEFLMYHHSYIGCSLFASQVKVGIHL